MSVADQIQKLQKSKHIEFSAISGYNYYYLPEDQQIGKLVYALHAQSDTIVYLVPITTGDSFFAASDIDWYKGFILKPMASSYFEWPVDLLQCKTVEGKYILYYAFLQRAYLDYVPIKKLLYQKKDSKVLDWRNTKICAVCRNFLAAMQQLDASDYSYHDFNIERIMYQESTGDIVLRHTMQSRRKQGKAPLDMLNPAAIATEFAPPFLYDDSYNGYLSAEADYYSIAAILFRLMIGRLPYEGRGLSNYGDIFDPIRDVDEINHKNYFLHYHKYPHFIFDTEDASNRLAPMQENDLPRERWEALPQEIKEMFQFSLCKDTAEGRKLKELYTPKQWLEACNHYCWNTSEYGGEHNG